jgi:septum formation protein
MPLARLIVLASTSRYRRRLMERLGVPFVVATPDVDETPLAGEAPAATAQRLAAAKAQAVAAAHADALIVGSDQVADCDGVAVSKPGDHAAAAAQLAAQSGRTIVFHTAVALLDSRSGTLGTALIDVRSSFRALDARTIEAYLRRDKPYDCAGAVRSESLGITLFERIDSDDPTALIGLPLIALSRLLREAGVDVVKALP